MGGIYLQKGIAYSNPVRYQELASCNKIMFNRAYSREYAKLNWRALSKKVEVVYNTALYGLLLEI